MYSYLLSATRPRVAAFAILLGSLVTACGGGEVVVPKDELKVTITRQSVRTTVSQPISNVPIATAKGGFSPYVFTGSNLPAGLIISSGGALSGTATAASNGTVTATVTVTDNNGRVATGSLTVDVKPLPTATPIAAHANRSCTRSALCHYTPINVVDGTSPYTVSSWSPPLPPGLSATVSSTGAVTVDGTPTATSANDTYTATIADSVGATTTASIKLRVNPALTLTSTPAPQFCTVAQFCTVGVLTLSGGTAPITIGSNPPLPSTLNLNQTSAAISGTPSATLARGTYRVTATDSVGATSFADVTLEVASVLQATVAVPTVTSTVNHPFTTAFPVGAYPQGMRPVTGAGGAGALRYTLETAIPGMTINAQTGALAGAPTTVGTITRTVRITDERGTFVTAQFNLVVRPVVAATPVSPSPQCTRNALCTFGPVTAVGGTGTLSYSIVGPPSLPQGMLLDGPTGVISGTPSVQSALTTYTMQVMDAVNATANASFGLTVNPALTATAKAASPACTVNTTCAFETITMGGGTLPRFVRITPNLPAGLELDSITTAISGVATVSSALKTYTITLRDAAGATATANFDFAVNGPLSATVVTPVVESTVGISFATAFPSGVRPVQGGGGTGALSYEIAPTLPGLLLFGADGSITGTPSTAYGPSTHTVTVRDQAGANVPRGFSLRINPALAAGVSQGVIFCTRTLTCSVQPIGVSGGTAPIVVTISPPLPNGLSINADGTLSGTPSALQSAIPYTATFRDKVGSTAIAAFTLSVSEPLATVLNVASPIYCGTSNGCTVAVPFTPVLATSGVAPYTYTVLPSLPPGLQLNQATGVVTGAATVGVNTTPFTVTVKDAIGSTSSKAFSLSVLAATQLLTDKACTRSPQMYDLTKCQHTPIAASGGDGALVYSLSASSQSTFTGLGMSFSAASGALTGMANNTLAQTTMTIRVTDSRSRYAESTYQFKVNSFPILSLPSSGIDCGDGSGCFPALPWQMTASGGTPPYSFDPLYGSSYQGLTLDPIAMTIGGAPTQGAPAGQVGFGVMMRDAGGAYDYREVYMTSLLSTLLLPSVTCHVGVPCSFLPVQKNGGIATPTYVVYTGTLPGTMTINNSTGQISGTASATLAPTNITIRLSIGSVWTQKTFSLRVDP